MSSRVHVKCTKSGKDGSTTIWYWAVPASSVEYANRFMTAAATALASGRQLVFSYTPGDTTGNSWGCSSSDCRYVWGFRLE